MKQSTLLRCMFLMLISGCTSVFGSDPRDALISDTINQANAAATALGGIKGAIADAIKKVEKEKRPLAAKDLEEAVKQTDTLKSIGKEMQKIKQKTDALKETTTEDDRKKLAEKYRDRVGPAMTSLQEKQEELNQVLAQAKKMESQKDALDPFLAKFREAQGEFAVMAKQR